MAESATITLTRNSEDDVKQRQVIVKVDGERVGDLMFGKTMTRELEPGDHVLRLDNTWNKKTVEFRLAAGENAKFKVVNRAGLFTWFLVASLGAGPMYVSVEKE